MGEINLYDKIVIKNKKKEHGEIKEIVYINLHL